MKQHHSFLLSFLLATSATVSDAKRAENLPRKWQTPRRLYRGQGNAAAPKTPLADAPPRGGGAVKPLYTPGRVPIELNPNYVTPPWKSQSQKASSSTAVFSSPQPSFAAELKVQEATTSANLAHDTAVVPAASTTTSSAATCAVTDYRAGWSATSYNSKNYTWLQNLKLQFLVMYRSSPSLTATLVACIAVFMAWQIQPRSTLLQHYFVLSRANMRHVMRWPSLLLSAVSHMDPLHLFFNLYGLWSLGPSVQRSLQQVGVKMGPFLGGAAAASSFMFLLLQGRSGGALGLSGVTLAVLALYARMHPTTVMAVRLAGIIPVRIKAENLLVCLTAWSALGSISSATRSNNIGHAPHLGGLLFGVIYHQWLVWRQQRHYHKPTTVFQYHYA